MTGVKGNAVKKMSNKDVKPVGEGCSSEQEHVIYERVRGNFNQAGASRRDFESSKSLPRQDDLRDEHNGKILKNRKLHSFHSVPAAPLEPHVIKIGRAKCCTFTSGQGRSILLIKEDNNVPRTVDFSKRYRDNAERIIEDMKSIGPQKIDTELSRYGEAQLTRLNKYTLIIFKGSGCGCKFSAKTLFQEELNRNEEAVAYCLTDPKHFSDIDLNQKSVILVLDACGGTQFDKHRMDRWYEVVRNSMPSAPGPVLYRDLTIIMTIQNFDEVNNHPLLKEYSTYVLDATSKIVRPSNETKKKMVHSIMKQHFYEIELPQNKTSAESNCSFLKQELIDNISPLLGSIGYVRVLNQFFRNKTSEGIQFFEKPIPEFVDRFRKDFEENKEMFLTMLAVYSHDGRNPFPRMLKYCSVSQTAQSFAMNKHEEYRLNLLWKLANENNMSQDLGDILERHAPEMEGLFLEESNGIYKFASKSVNNSFLVVLCERFAEAIEFCEEEFFFKCIKPKAGDGKLEYLLVDGHSDNTRLKAFVKRLIRELLEGNVSKCMNHPVLSPQLFGRILLRLKRKRHLAWKVLNMQDKDISAPFSCLVFGMMCQSTLPNGNNNNNRRNY